jgi:hypothetical protein
MSKPKATSPRERLEKRTAIRHKLQRLLRGSLRNSCAPLTAAAKILEADLFDADVPKEDHLLALLAMCPSPRAKKVEITRLSPVQDAAIDVRDALILINRPEIHGKEHLLGIQGRRDLELIRFYLESAQRKLVGPL